MAPGPVPVAQVRLLAFNNEEIGMGFNSDTGIAVGTALEGFTIHADPVATGQAVTSQIVIVNSHEELMDNLSMSFDAQGRYGFISGSAKASFAENSSYNSTSTFLVAQCLVSNPMTRGQNFQVTQPAQALLSTQRFADFKTAFGDSFVRGLHTGGEYFAVIRITSVSVSKQKDLSATLHAEAQGLVASGSFQAQFQEANSSDSTRSEYTASMFQQAGTGTQISPTVQIDEVLSRYKQFPQIALANPGAYETEVATYDTLPLPTPTAEQQEDFVLAMADARDKKLHYIQTRNDLTFALANPGFFQGLPPVTVLTAASETYTKLINAVVEHAVALSQGQISPPVFFDPAALTPPLAEQAPIALQRAADGGTQHPGAQPHRAQPIRHAYHRRRPGTPRCLHHARDCGGRQQEWRTGHRGASGIRAPQQGPRSAVGADHLPVPGHRPELAGRLHPRPGPYICHQRAVPLGRDHGGTRNDSHLDLRSAARHLSYQADWGEKICLASRAA